MGEEEEVSATWTPKTTTAFVCKGTVHMRGLYQLTSAENAQVIRNQSIQTIWTSTISSQIAKLELLIKQYMTRCTFPQEVVNNLSLLLNIISNFWLVVEAKATPKWLIPCVFVLILEVMFINHRHMILTLVTLCIHLSPVMETKILVKTLVEEKGHVIGSQSAVVGVHQFTMPLTISTTSLVSATHTARRLKDSKHVRSKTKMIKS
jgi:hypothetical protein